MANFARKRYDRSRQLYYVHAVTHTVTDGPLVSIIVPCFNTPPKYFEPLLSSIFAQGYQNWELVLVDASTDDSLSDYIHTRAQNDTRITYLRTQNEGIALNTNKGIAAASGVYIAFLDHDDTLDPNALAQSVALLESGKGYDLVYSDEDKISDDGSKYFDPHFKPDFSLDMLRNVNYITHFVVLKKSIADQLQGIRSGFDGAQDYDFLLRVVDTGAKMGHVPEILYHWREAEGSTAADFSNKTHVTDAGCRALTDHYERNGIHNVKVEAIPLRPGFYRPIYQPAHPNYKVILDLERYHFSQAELQYIQAKYEANEGIKKYGIKVHVAKEKPKKEPGVLIVSEPIVPASRRTDIVSMFELAEEPGVYAVAPKITRQGKVYDMGIIHQQGVDMRLFNGLSLEKPLSFGSLEWVRNVSAVTGAVTVYSGARQGRVVIWSHAEFVALLEHGAEPSHEEPNFYNPNLDVQLEVVEFNDDYIVDRLKVKQ